MNRRVCNSVWPTRLRIYVYLKHRQPLTHYSCVKPGELEIMVFVANRFKSTNRTKIELPASIVLRVSALWRMHVLLMHC
jgi:hypothetical protein